jgi:serine/threonine protein kinase
LHEVRHLVHRDINPANVLINLKGEAKITDFEISAGLDNTLAMVCYFGDNHPSCSTNVAVFMFDITLGIVPASTPSIHCRQMRMYCIMNSQQSKI